MTTGTNTPEVLTPAPALTVDEVLAVVQCPLCGPSSNPACHELARLRAAVRLAAEANA